jgi:hypothetical protein
MLFKFCIQVTFKTYNCPMLSILQFLLVLIRGVLPCFICINIYIYTFLQVWYTHAGGLRGRVVKVVDLRSLVPHRCRFDPHLGRNLLCEEAIQLAYGRSLVLPGCPLMPEIMPGGAPGVFLHQYKLEKNRRKNLGGTL